MIQHPDRHTDFDRTWNAACALEPASQLPGDRGLHTLLLFHGLTMNGGLHHAVDRDEDYATPAATAARRFDLPQLAAVIERAHATKSSAEIESLDEEYHQLLPHDHDLADAVHRYWSDHPDEFTPA